MFITPTVVGEQVFVGSCAGRFYGIDRYTGDISWQYNSTQDGQIANFHGDPIIVGERIVVGSDVAHDADGHVYCFERSNGRLLWKYAVPGGVISKIEYDDGVVFGVSRDGDLICLRLSDGSLVWRTRPDAEVERHSLAYDVLLNGTRVIYSSIAGTVTAIDASSGTEAWTSSLQGTINTGLALQDTSLWAGTHEGELHRIDIRTGDLLHTYQLGKMPYGTPLVLERSLLVLLDGNTLAHISTDDGSTLWQLEATDEWSSFKPKLHAGLVWVGNGRGELVGVSLESGKPTRTLIVEGTVRGFHIEDDVTYIGTLQGRMYALLVSHD